MTANINKSKVKPKKKKIENLITLLNTKKYLGALKKGTYMFATLKQAYNFFKNQTHDIIYCIK